MLESERNESGRSVQEVVIERMENEIAQTTRKRWIGNMMKHKRVYYEDVAERQARRGRGGTPGPLTRDAFQLGRVVRDRRQEAH